MQIKIKKLHPNAVIPKYSKNGDAGLDLTAVEMKVENGYITYHTGLAVEIPNGYVGLVFPRSSICNTDLALTNSVGVIDSGYRGEILVKFKPTLIADKSQKDIVVYTKYCIKTYEIGERVAQLIIMPYPQIDFVEVEELSKTERGSGGYGSTGK